MSISIPVTLHNVVIHESISDRLSATKLYSLSWMWSSKPYIRPFTPWKDVTKTKINNHKWPSRWKGCLTKKRFEYVCVWNAFKTRLKLFEMRLKLFETQGVWNEGKGVYLCLKRQPVLSSVNSEHNYYCHSKLFQYRMHWVIIIFRFICFLKVPFCFIEAYRLWINLTENNVAEEHILLAK